MIKVTTKYGNTNLHVEGSLKDIMADTFCIIRSVWQAIDENDKDAGNHFKDEVMEKIHLAFKSDEEIADAVMNKGKDELIGCLDELADALKDLMDELDKDKEDEE